MRHEHADVMLAERKKNAFTSIDEVKSRTKFSKEELRTVAQIGALNGLAKHRRDALWEVEKELPTDDLFSKNIESCSRGRESAHSESETSQRRLTSAATDQTEQCPLEPMTMPERLHADYTGMEL